MQTFENPWIVSPYLAGNDPRLTPFPPLGAGQCDHPGPEEVQRISMCWARRPDNGTLSCARLG